MAEKKGLHLRLFDIERDLKNIKETALFPQSEKLRELIEIIQDSFREIRRELRAVNDGLSQTEACVEEMGRDHVKKADLQSYLDDKIREAVEKIVMRNDEPEDRPERGLFLKGVGKLRERLDSSYDDPCDVVHTVLHKVGSAAFYTKIVPILPHTKIRNDSDQAIIYFSSVYHRKYASAELRRFFAREKIASVGLRDLFEKKDVELAKKMTRLGFQMRQEGTICRFRVSNIRGAPVFFSAGQDRKYSEMEKRTLQAKLDSMH